MAAPARRLRAIPDETGTKISASQTRYDQDFNDMSQPYWFWLCECGKCGGNTHGYFRINGVRSAPFTTKKQGEAILMDAMERNLLSDGIAVAFEEVLHMAYLPENIGD